MDTSALVDSQQAHAPFGFESEAASLLETVAGFEGFAFVHDACQEGEKLQHTAEQEGFNSSQASAHA